METIGTTVIGNLNITAITEEMALAMVARKLMLPSFSVVNLFLIGCGGTGSWLAPAVVRIGKILKERGLDVNIVFQDGDTVEEKNTLRQNFCQAEIGRNKAETLAMRYGLSWGMEVAAVPAYLSSQKEPSSMNFYRKFNEELTVYLGCVDNPAGRQAIHQALTLNGDKTRTWWLDCGNEFASGQILLGRCGEISDKNFVFENFINWFPSPALVHPELIIQAEALEESEPVSCADIALMDAQGLSINQVMAAHAADYLLRMLVTKDLSRYATYVDMNSGSVRSKTIGNPWDIPPWWKGEKA